jgi:hypothetical protein
VVKFGGMNKRKLLRWTWALSLFTFCLVGTSCWSDQEKPKDSIPVIQAPRVVETTSGCGYADSTGWKITPQFDLCGEFSEGFAPVVQKGLLGYINFQGEFVLKPTYPWLRKMDSRGLGNVDLDVRDAQRRMEWAGFQSGHALVQDTQGLWFFLNRKFEIASSKRFRSSWGFSESWASVQDSLAWWLVDSTGSQKVGPFAGLGLKSEGLIPAQKLAQDSPKHPDSLVQSATSGGLWGFVDSTGNWVIPPRFDQASSFSEGYAVVDSGGLQALMDPQGQVSEWFQEVSPLSEGMWYHKSPEGFVWRQRPKSVQQLGFVVGETWSDLRRFRSGIAAVKKDGNWSYIGVDGSKHSGLWQRQNLDSAGSFMAGIAKIKQQGIVLWIDARGAEISLMKAGEIQGTLK